MGGGPPDFPQGSTCLAVLRILPVPSSLRIRGSHPVSHAFPEHFCWESGYLMQSFTPPCQAGRFRLVPFRSPLLRESMFLSFPPATSMFQFTGFPPHGYGFTVRYRKFVPVGFPIQTSAGQWIFAPHRSFSQLITSFFGSQCQGIHPAPL